MSLFRETPLTISGIDELRAHTSADLGVTSELTSSARAAVRASAWRRR
jgi:hypothetical protein